MRRRTGATWLKPGRRKLCQWVELIRVTGLCGQKVQKRTEKGGKKKGRKNKGAFEMMLMIAKRCKSGQTLSFKKLIIMKNEEFL